MLGTWWKKVLAVLGGLVAVLAAGFFAGKRVRPSAGETWEAIKVEIQGLKADVQLARQEQTLLLEKHQKQEALWTTAYSALTESWNEQNKDLTVCKNWSRVWIGAIIVETALVVAGGLVLWLR